MKIEGDALTGGNVDVEEVSDVRIASNHDGGTGGEKITAAIGDLPSSGGMVFVPAEGPDANGRWEIDQHLTVPSNVVLRGVSGATRIVSTGQHAYLQIRGQDGNTVQNAGIEGIDYRDASGTGTGRINVQEARDCWVRDCVSADGKYGVHVKLAQDCLVENCRGVSVTDDSFTATDTQTGISGTRNVVFRDCVSRGGDQTQSGFEVDDGPHDVRFVDCKAYGGLYGFRTHTHRGAVEGAPEEIYWTRCRSEGASEYGFCFGANGEGTPRGYHLTQPTVRNAGECAIAADVRGEASPITIEGVEITDPDVVHSAQAPAIGLDTAAPLRDWHIEGGEIRTTANHPVVTTRGADVFGLTLEDVLVAGGETAQIGVEIAARDGGLTRNVTVRDCTVRNCRQNGIDARSGGTGNGLSNVQLIDNAVYNNGRDSSKDDPLRAGICATIVSGGTPPEFVTIRGNHCFNTPGAVTQTHGIFRKNLETSIVTENILWNHTTTNLGGSAGTGLDKDNIGSGA